MALNDTFHETGGDVFPRHASTVTGIATVTPAASEVSVQTQSLDSGVVVLYDAAQVELDRVPCNSGAYEDTANVGGTEVEYVRVFGADAKYSGETVTVNDDTGGTGTDTTVDVTSDDSESQIVVDGSGTETGAAELFEFGGGGTARVYRETDTNGDGTYDVTVWIDEPTDEWHSQKNQLVVSQSSNHILRIVNVGDAEADYFVTGMEVSD